MRPFCAILTAWRPVMRGAALGLALLLAGPPGALPAAAAQEPMSAEQFDAYATGKTLSYAQGSEIWGAEQYLPGRRVVWAFSAEECQYGRWYPQGEHICFVYDANPDPQCWTFWQDGSGLRARFAGSEAGSDLAEVGQSDEPLACPGPDLGV